MKLIFIMCFFVVILFLFIVFQALTYDSSSISAQNQLSNKLKTTDYLDVPFSIGDNSFSNKSFYILPVKGGYVMKKTPLGLWVKINSKNIKPRSKISFIDQNRGWLVNGNRILQTTDGGANWFSLGKIGNTSEEFNSATKIHFIDKNVGWILDSFKLWKTVNGGKSWNSVILPSSEKNNEIITPTCFFSIEDEYTWIGSQVGKIYQISNRIIKNYSSSINSECLAIYFFNKSIGWSVVGKTLLFTDDSGETWSKLYEFDNLMIQSATFKDRNEGWVVGKKVNPSFVSKENNKNPFCGIILQTQDGGKSWEENLGDCQEGAFTNVFFDTHTPKKGWVIGENKVLETNDGGKNWKVSLQVSN